MKIQKEYPEKDKFYHTVLKVLGCFIEEERRLTPTEEFVLIRMIEDNSIIEGRKRKKLCDELGCSTQALSAHLKRIKLKGWVDDYMCVDPTLELINKKINEGKFELTVAIKYG